MKTTWTNDTQAALLAKVDWNALTRPSRDPVERVFFERLGIPTRAREMTPGEVPTADQVTSMAEAAGKSRWNFCAKLPGSGQHDCISGFPVYSPAYPSGASCFSALHGINAMLKRETTADQAKVCTYPTRP